MHITLQHYSLSSFTELLNESIQKEHFRYYEHYIQLLLD